MATKIVIDKDYFATLSKGSHTIRANFVDGYAEGEFSVDDKITFYIHEEAQIPFTATRGMTWGNWISSYNLGSSGNNILWVGFDNKTLYIDPRGTVWQNTTGYPGYSLGDTNLRFCYNGTPQSLSDTIVPNGIYGSYNMCCFDAGTQILMADGTTKNIEEIAAGDVIISYNVNSEKFEEDVVEKAIIKHNSDDLVYVNLSNGVQLGMRAYHPLLTTNGWKSLRPEMAEYVEKDMPMLEIGDVLVGFDANVTVESIVCREPISDYDTYNFSVQNNKNYVANGVIVHNASCPT